MSGAYDEFRCPECLGQLAENADGAVCEGCRREYAKKGGILDLRMSRNDYYFNPVSREDMETIRTSVDRKSWAKYIRFFVEKTNFNSTWIDNLVTNGRYAWKLLLGFDKDAKVLDLGCGLGALTQNVSPHVGTVYAMDLTMARLEFAEKRFSIFNGDDRIKLIAGGDGPKLPFPDDHLDGVILSGVLEWMGEGDTSSFETGSKPQRLMNMLRAETGDTNPRRIQVSVLNEIRRVLKPDGELFIGIENRLNSEYFGKRRDHHSGIWFGSLMPRPVATLYSILVSRKPYRTYTYSIPGYRKLLRETGFSDVDFLGLFQGYSDLRRIVPSAFRMKSWKPASDKETGMGRYFVPAYGIVAKGTGAGRKTAILERVLADAASVLGGEPSFSDFEITGKDKGVLFANAGGRDIIIKLPFSEPARAAEERNADALAALATAHPETTLPAPAFLARGEVQNQPYFVETRLTGTPIADSLSPARLKPTLDAVQSFIDRLVPATSESELSGETYDRLVGQPIARLSEIIGAADRETLDDYFSRNLKGASAALGRAHGDFSAANLFERDGEIIGAIDWEAADAAGLPVVDAINFLESAHRHLHPEKSLADTIPALASGEGLNDDEENFLNAQFRKRGVATDRRAAFVYLYWLRHVAQQVPYFLQFDEMQIRRVVTPVIGQLRQR